MKLLYVFVLIIAFPLAAAIASDMPYEQAMFDSGRHVDVRLSADLLNRIANAIQFAFDQGAASTIGESDLHHAHLLFRSKAAPANAEPDAILLHSQYKPISRSAYAKRNILAQDSKLRILPCKLGRANRTLVVPGEFFCTVTAEDLGMYALRDIYFFRVDNLPPESRRRCDHNARTIRGEKIFFFLYGIKEPR